MSAVLDLDDIQGLVARGFGDQKSACYVLLTMPDRAGAGAWLESLAGELTPASAKPAGDAVNVALTTSGLARLGVPDATRQRFSHEFFKGMADPYRSRVLGDVDDVAPDRWIWGGPSAPVDAVLLLYAVDKPALDATYEAHAARFRDHGLVEVRRLDTADLDDTEPFGFRDGIAQPIIEGLSTKTGSPGNTIKAGEFVLGYPNEYGLYTSRPVVDAADDPGGLLPRRRGRDGWQGPGPQRHLPGTAPAGAGPRRVLGIPRPVHHHSRRHQRPVRPGTAGGQDDRPLAQRGAPRPRPRRRRPQAGRGRQLRVPRRGPTRPEVPDRRPHPPHEPAGLPSPRPRHRPVDRHQQASPPAASRSGVRGHDHPRAGPGERPHGTAPSRPRAPLRVPQRQHRPPVRVRAAHVGQQPQLRRPPQRARPADLADGGGRLPHPRPARAHPPHRPAPVRHRPGRGLLLPARAAGGALDGVPGAGLGTT